MDAQAIDALITSRRLAAAEISYPIEDANNMVGCYANPSTKTWTMTLALALAGEHDVVMVADTLGHTNDPGGMYRKKRRKIYAVNNGAWGIAVAGSHYAIDLVKHLNRSKEFVFTGHPDEDADNYLRALSAARQEYGHNKEQMWFLLVGLDKKSRPFIYRLDLPPDTLGYATEASERDAIGATTHGGLYFFHQYHRPDMSATDRISLGHFCVGEVATQDIRVGSPLDVAVVDVSGFMCCEDSAVPSIIDRSKEIASLIRSQFTAQMTSLDLEVLRSSVA